MGCASSMEARRASIISLSLKLYTMCSRISLSLCRQVHSRLEHSSSSWSNLVQCVPHPGHQMWASRSSASPPAAVCLARRTSSKAVQW